MVYTIAERLRVVSLYYGNNESANSDATLFNERHEINASRKYVTHLTEKFKETDSVANEKACH